MFLQKDDRVWVIDLKKEGVANGNARNGDERDPHRKGRRHDATRWFYQIIFEDHPPVWRSKYEVKKIKPEINSG